RRAAEPVAPASAGDGPADDSAGADPDDDQFHPHHRRAGNPAPGARAAAVAAEPGAYWAGAVPVAVRDGADAGARQRRGDRALLGRDHQRRTGDLRCRRPIPRLHDPPDAGKRSGDVRQHGRRADVRIRVRSSILDPPAGIRDQRTQDRVPDRLHAVPALPGHRPRRLQRADESRHDDDEPDARIFALQAAAVRPGGRMGAADGLPGGELHLVMNELPTLLSFADRMLWTTALVAAPVLLASLAVGLVIGLVQAATSVNEQTLTFVPKLAAIAIVLVLFGASMMTLLGDFMHEIFAEIARTGQ